MLAKSMTAAQSGSTTWARPNLPADVARLNAAITPRIAQTSRTTRKRDGGGSVQCGGFGNFPGFGCSTLQFTALYPRLVFRRLRQ